MKKRGEIIKIKVEGISAKGGASINGINSLRRLFNVVFLKSVIKENPITKTFTLTMSCFSEDEKSFHNFLGKLSQNPGVIRVMPLLSVQKQRLLALWIIITAIVWIFLPFFIHWERGVHFSSYAIINNLLAYIGFIPVLITNYIIYSFIRNYFSQIRNTFWPILIGTILNFTGFSIFAFALLKYNLLSSVLIPFSLFLIISLVTMWQYISRNINMDESYRYENIDIQGISTKEKLKGYFFRISAVLIFGVTPVLIKYFLSEVNGLAIVSISFWIALISLMPLIIIKSLKGNFKDNKKYTKSFWIAVIFDGLVVLFYFLSVRLTYASNAILFLNFAPVVAIIFALLFWQHKITYLQNKKDARNIIAVFILGTIGTSLLVLNKSTNAISNFNYKLLGDFLSFLAMLFDVVATVALISYIKNKNIFTGLDYIIRKVIILAVIFSPFAIFYLFKYTFSIEQFLILLFLGVFNVIFAYYFAYEAYKRLDGFINYLLFNLAPLFTIILEIVYFKLPPTILFILGGSFIIISSIGAEYINTKSQKIITYTKQDSSNR